MSLQDISVSLYLPRVSYCIIALGWASKVSDEPLILQGEPPGLGLTIPGTRANICDTLNNSLVSLQGSLQRLKGSFEHPGFLGNGGPPRLHNAPLILKKYSQWLLSKAKVYDYIMGPPKLQFFQVWSHYNDCEAVLMMTYGTTVNSSCTVFDWLRVQMSYCSSKCIIFYMFLHIPLEHCSLFFRMCCSSELLPIGEQGQVDHSFCKLLGR